MNQSRILYEDKDLIVCHKPAGIATQTARVGQADMVSEVANYLALTARGNAQAQDGQMQDRHRPERDDGLGIRPYVGVVHRLDQPVEGILVFAKNKQSAAALGRQITENRMEKYYYAIVCGRQLAQRGELADYLLKDGKTNTSRIVPAKVRDAKRAVLDYEILARKALSGKNLRAEASPETCNPEQGKEEEQQEKAAQEIRKEQEMQKEQGDAPMYLALARIRLHTGRHHQIRVQMSHAGMSLLGDYKYADDETAEISGQLRAREIALCAYRLALSHPRTGKRLQFIVRPEGKSFQTAEFAACYDEV